MQAQHIWLVTFPTYRRKPVFENELLREICAEAFCEACQRNEYRVYALAIMPDHVHFVLNAGASGHVLAKMMQNIKGLAAYRVFRASPELKTDMLSEHLWVSHYDSRVLPDSNAVRRACRYVEENPVKLGYPRQHYSWLTSPVGVPITGLKLGL